jgi:hypothetical protein
MLDLSPGPHVIETGGNASFTVPSDLGGGTASFTTKMKDTITVAGPPDARTALVTTPEPASALVMVTGLLGVAAIIRKRGRHDKPMPGAAPRRGEPPFDAKPGLG